MCIVHGRDGVLYDRKGWSPKLRVGIFEEPKNHRTLLALTHFEKDCYLAKSYVRGRDGVLFDRKGWSPKILIGIFKEPKGPRAT